MKTKILLIYTGGTIGMTKDNTSNTLVPFNFENVLDAIPELKTEQISLNNISTKTPIDSSNINHENWIEITRIIKENYTSSNCLFAMGGSAGGLLIGAVINMKPQLWKAAIAAVPFVDVVTTMLDESIPLTTGEYDEWGNPNDKVYYDYMKSYSPYDNIKNQQYPNLLITTGLHDSQVQYWEPAKWIARLRLQSNNSSDLFLKTNMDAGHGGSSGRFEALKEVASEYAFLFDLESIEK